MKGDTIKCFSCPAVLSVDANVRYFNVCRNRMCADCYDQQTLRETELRPIIVHSDDLMAASVAKVMQERDAAQDDFHAESKMRRDAESTNAEQVERIKELETNLEHSKTIISTLSQEKTGNKAYIQTLENKIHCAGSALK